MLLRWFLQTIANPNNKCAFRKFEVQAILIGESGEFPYQAFVSLAGIQYLYFLDFNGLRKGYAVCATVLKIQAQRSPSCCKQKPLVAECPNGNEKFVAFLRHLQATLTFARRTSIFCFEHSH
jgi:hypothetical protein